MTTPLVRGFRQRVWIAVDSTGVEWLLEDEAHAREAAARVGWTIREYSLVREPGDSPPVVERTR